MTTEQADQSEAKVEEQVEAALAAVHELERLERVGGTDGAAYDNALTTEIGCRAACLEATEDALHRLAGALGRRALPDGAASEQAVVGAWEVVQLLRRSLAEIEV